MQHDILVQLRKSKFALLATYPAFMEFVKHLKSKILSILGTDGECHEQFTYGFNVVLFETTCSPYSLQSILHIHLPDNTKGQEFVDKFYVDNYMHIYDEEILINNKVILEEIMSGACMPLQGRTSNNQQFNSTYEVNSSPTQNVLGLAWYPCTGTLQVAL